MEIWTGHEMAAPRGTFPPHSRSWPPGRLSIAPAPTGPPRCASLSLGLAALAATSAPIGPPDCRRFAHWPRPAGGEERGPGGGAGQRHSRDGGRRLRTGSGERPGLGGAVPPGASLCMGTGNEGPVPQGTGVTSGRAQGWGRSSWQCGNTHALHINLSGE